MIGQGNKILCIPHSLGLDRIKGFTQTSSVDKVKRNPPIMNQFLDIIPGSPGLSTYKRT
ncbi:MAG: hypothetical protein JWQ98_1485 [Chlorobi bacterium]|nr:hypothetical protein [Chlorobiota bacterium]